MRRIGSNMTLYYRLLIRYLIKKDDLYQKNNMVYLPTPLFPLLF